jgi:hypothetical protein
VQLQPQKLESLIKWGIIFLLLGLLSLCSYSRLNEINEKRLRRIPTPENILRWQEIKKYQLNVKVCESMNIEVQSAKDNNFICIDSFETIVSRDKTLLDKYFPNYFDFYDIPEGYRSVKDIPVSIDSLICNNAEETVRRWKNCPTGYTYKN